MKKTKLALISMIVFITVFSMTAIIDIASFQTKKGNLTKDSKSVTAKSDSPTVTESDNSIQSFSVDITQSPQYSEIEDRANSDENILAEDAKNKSENTEAEAAVPTGNITDPAGSAAAPTGSISDLADSTAADVTSKAASKTVSVPKQEESKYSDIAITIAKDYVNLREKASTDSSILGKLYKDSAAKILKSKGDWYYVESGSVKGYVKSEFLKKGIPDKELVKKYGILSISVGVDGLNVRKKPSMDAKKVTVIYKDETYPVVKAGEKWIEINLPDEKANGYVLKEYADLLVEFKEAISKEEEEKQQQLEAEKRAEKETTVIHQEGRDYSVSDLQLLACLIHAEAGSQSYEGKLAVANVVLNRVKSSKYPDSIKAVIYQPGQFSVAHSGSLQKQLNNYKGFDSSLQLMSIKAAKDALAGANNIGKRMYFHSYRAAVRKGYDSKSTSVKIGNQLFW